MVLEKVDSPGDLKALAPEELPTLAEEIRQHIIEAVASVGGHLGSNLGAVELTIALHREFDSPHDTFLWDTGHQAYVHKILTGRRGQFDHLRQAGGLSGYPSRAESPHDVIENSHASTALSWAYGMALGYQSNGDDRHIVAIVGDGALTGGMAYEALNNIGHDGVPVIVVLNDNGRSYAQTVSRLSHEVDRLRTTMAYREWRPRLDKLVSKFPYGERLADASLQGIKAAISDAPALQKFVEALGIKYFGPIDGHDVEEMQHHLAAAKRVEGPVLVHVLTQKGKGYTPAETDPEKKLHDTSAFDIATGRARSKKPRSWTTVFSDQLVRVADEHPEVVAMTAAMPGSTGLLPLAQRHPDRVIDVGIAEQHAVTCAAGLSYAGKTPIVAVYSTFFTRAFDQANLDVGLHDEHVVFVFDRAGITGDDGASHHGILDLVLTLRIPAMTVLAPSCAEELEVMLEEAVGLSGPVSIRFPKGTAITGLGVGQGLKARRLREGSDLCFLSVGDRLQATLEAAEELARDGIEAAVWDVRCVRPVDLAMLDAAAESPLVITVENGFATGGAGSFLTDRLVERTGVREAPPVLRLGVPDQYIQHGKPDRILSELGLDAAGILAATRKALGRD